MNPTLEKHRPGALAGARPGENARPLHSNRRSAIVHEFVNNSDVACEHLIAGGFHDTVTLSKAVNLHGVGTACVTRVDLGNLLGILLLCAEAGIVRPSVELVCDYALMNNLPIVGDDNPADLAVLADPVHGPPSPIVLEVSASHVGYWAGQVVGFCQRRTALGDLHRHWMSLLEEGVVDAA
jgi:hypothetical protein